MIDGWYNGEFFEKWFVEQFAFFLEKSGVGKQRGSGENCFSDGFRSQWGVVQYMEEWSNLRVFWFWSVFVGSSFRNLFQHALEIQK
jgi:hypothetical protein